MKKSDVIAFVFRVLKHSKMNSNLGLREENRFGKLEGSTAVIPTFKFLNEFKKLNKKTSKTKKPSKA